MRFFVALDEFIIILLSFKKRRVKSKVTAAPVVLDLGDDFVKVDFSVSAERGSAGNVVERIFGTDSLSSEGFVEAFPQLAHKSERSAEIDYLALNLSALRESGDGLVYNRLEDTLRDVRLSCALVEKGLDVGLGENSAARSDGIGFFVLLGKLIHILERYVEQGRHLVDKSSGTSGAGAVHTNLKSSGKEQNLCVLSAELNYNVGAGDEGIRGYARSVNLLHKVNVAALGNAHSGASAHSHVGVHRLGNLPADNVKNLADFLCNLRIMALVCAVYQVVAIIKNHAFYGS